jgi:predicted DNA-binding transcriptional regulator YafY
MLVRLLLREPISKVRLIETIQVALGENGYPADVDSALKKDIESLKREFGCNIGFHRKTGLYELRSLGELAILDLTDDGFEALLFLDANFPEGDALPEFVHIRALLHQIHQLLPAERRGSLDKRNLVSLQRMGTSIDRVPPQLLRALRHAIWRQEISFEYISNQPGAPHVWHRAAPYQIVFKPDGHAYLDAATLETEPADATIKLPLATSYRLDRIAGETLRILPTTLPPHRLGVKTYTIQYHLHPNVARRKDIAHHFPDSQVVYHEDESATVTAKATNLWQARQTLFRYGSACVVEEPPELVELFKKAIREMANAYGIQDINY